jgi:hypothetical protein
MTLVQIHAALVCLWMGVIAGETVLELMHRDAASRRYIADVHGWIDTLFEFPLVVAVVISGALLLSRVDSVSTLLMVKVGAALVGVLANLYCIVLVRQRIHARDDARVLALTRQIHLTGLAIPFGLTALAIGFGAFHG